MWRTSFVLGLLFAASAGPSSMAEESTCGPALAVLQKAAADSEAKLKSVSETTEAARAKVISTYRAIPDAIAKIAAARAQNAEADLDRAINNLTVAKKTYDAAVAAERPLIIARLENERVTRGARQAMREAIARLREQGEALVKAVARAKRGEVTPSLSDLLSCEQDECARIPRAEHAAMIAIGAIADTVDPAPWPLPQRECDFTLFDKPSSPKAMARALMSAQKEALSHLKIAEGNVVTARQVLAAAIPSWNGAITGLLNEHASPAGNSHADELLGMAIEDLRKQDQAFEKATVPYRTADEAAVASQSAALAATEKLIQHYEYWADLGTAVIDMATRAERGANLKNTKPCQVGPTNQAGPWVFALTPPTNCQHRLSE